MQLFVLIVRMELEVHGVINALREISVAPIHLLMCVDHAFVMLMETSVIRLREVIAIAETTLTQISMLVAQRGPRKFPMTAGSSNVQNAKNIMLGIL